MKILIAEPFMGGSHAAWAEGYKKHSGHEVSILSLSGHHWKWRMQGGTITLAGRFSSLPKPDLIMASDMLDLCRFVALSGSAAQRIPTVLYMHENQLCYPTRGDDQRDFHYAFTNYSSALVADYLCFNSNFHREVFLNALPDFLSMFPRPTTISHVAGIREKSIVLEPGLDLESLEVAAPDRDREAPVILWNHRWEFDKNPEAFYRLLCRLRDAGHDFRLILMGSRNQVYPSVFDKMRSRFKSSIVFEEYPTDRHIYAQWLHRADMIPVTSIQDFYGMSLLEAMYCGVHPIVPDRLALPEHFTFNYGAQHIYKDEDELYEKTAALLTGKKDEEAIERCKREAARRDWRTVAPQYDRFLEALMASRHSPA